VARFTFGARGRGEKSGELEGCVLTQSAAVISLSVRGHDVDSELVVSSLVLSRSDGDLP